MSQTWGEHHSHLRRRLWHCDQEHKLHLSPSIGFSLGRGVTPATGTLQRGLCTNPEFPLGLGRLSPKDPFHILPAGCESQGSVLLLGPRVRKSWSKYGLLTEGRLALVIITVPEVSDWERNTPHPLGRYLTGHFRSQLTLLPHRLHCASSLSRVWLFATPWTVARQVSLIMGFSRQEDWSGLPCPPPEDLPNHHLQMIKVKLKR